MEKVEYKGYEIRLQKHKLLQDMYQLSIYKDNKYLMGIKGRLAYDECIKTGQEYINTHINNTDSRMFESFNSYLLKEAFSLDEKDLIVTAVSDCYDDKGEKGINDYDTLNKYLGKLKFEVDAADIEIGKWEIRKNIGVKVLPIKLQNELIGHLIYK
jgi:hypothetical protein